MTYAVIWTVEAIAQLTRLEAETDDPGRIRAAGAWADYALRRMPFDLGESRDGNERLWYGDVLGIFFAVDAIALTVRVKSVSLARRRR